MDKLMSQKEVKRSLILDRLKESEISQREGLAGLISKKRGCTSNHRLDKTLCATAIKLIGAHYCDFGPARRWLARS